MHTPRKIVYSEAMSPQRFAQEAVLRAQETILAAALQQNPPPVITDDYAADIAKQAEAIGHATAEVFATPRMPD